MSPMSPWGDILTEQLRGDILMDQQHRVRRPIDGGGLSGLACRSPGPARSTREEAADVHCGSGFWGGQRPSLAHYVTGMGPMDGATAAGGRSCCLSSVEKARSRVQDYGQGTVGMKRVNVITNEGTRLCARRLRISSLFSSGAR